MSRYYTAPWDKTLMVMSWVTTGICVFVAFAVFRYGHWVAGSFVLLIVFACALFTVRGYTVSTDAILVHRLVWKTRLPLAEIKSVEANPEAMKGSIRTFGNGGCFSYSGFFRNKRLGNYRALVTDPTRAVILRFEKMPVVLSPDRPDAFVRAMNEAMGTRA